MEPTRLAWILAAGMPLVSLPAYAIAGPTAGGTVATALPVALGFAAGGLAMRRPWRYYTWPMRTETGGLALVAALLAYVAVGYPLLALLHFIATQNFPLTEPLILRYMLVWPFYFWLVIGCSGGVLPCPDAPAPVG